MSVKSFAAKLFAQYIHNTTQKWAQNPIETQQKVFKDLIQKAKKTQFGKDHHFDAIHSYEDFQKQVPIRDYEQLRSYVDEVVKEKKTFFGQENLFILPKLPEPHREPNIFR